MENLLEVSRRSISRLVRSLRQLETGRYAVGRADACGVLASGDSSQAGRGDAEPPQRTIMCLALAPCAAESEIVRSNVTRRPPFATARASR